MTNSVFTISGFEISIVGVLMCTLVLLIAIYTYYRLSNYDFFDNQDKKVYRLQQKSFKIKLALALFFVSILLILRVLNFDMFIYDYQNFGVTINQIIEIFALFSCALLADWLISHVVIKNKFRKREIPVRTTFSHENTNEQKATKLVRYIVYLYILQVLLKKLDLDYILFQREINKEIFTVHISDLIVAFMILMGARIIVWFITQVTLFRMYRSKDMDEGIQYAINQLVMYVVYVMAFLFALDRVVSDMSIIYGGAAALLVGVGLGLQQTFNDFFSGLVLLFERTVMVGDILEIDGKVGRVLKIGLRASRIETRDSVSMLVPNSKLVNQSVVNWTHYDNIVRFQVDVNVAYGTDANQVKMILLEAARNAEDVLKIPDAFVRLNDFGDNGILFTVYFFTTQVMTAENVKSNVRFEIDKLFHQNNITIPFPQRDLRIIDSGQKTPINP
jgi:small-conductance mechanosensitive channel